MFFTSLSSKICAVSSHFPSKLTSFPFFNMSTENLQFTLASDEPPKERLKRIPNRTDQIPTPLPLIDATSIVIPNNPVSDPPPPPPKRNYASSDFPTHPPEPPTKPPPINYSQVKWFEAMDTSGKNAGKISAKDLQQAFETFQEPTKDALRETFKRLPTRTAQQPGPSIQPHPPTILVSDGESKKRLYGDPISRIPMEPTKAIKRLPSVHPEVTKWFEIVDAKNVGKISAKELQQAFETFQGRHFSDSACKFVVRLFDLDKTGGIDVREFEQLYFYVKQWVNAFNAYDRERSGFLDEKELDYALKYMDINFSPDFIKFLLARSDQVHKRMSLDQFIMTCIQIQRYTDEFKSRDENYTGIINIKYEDFLEMILRCF